MLDSLLNLATPWGYIVVALLVAGEAAAFVGLVLPGETAAFLGGVLAYQGGVDLNLMLLSACLGAVVGDTIGYQVGKQLGPRLRKGRFGRWVGDERWDRATKFLRRHGGRAVFLGRWIGVLRALVPSLAGAAGIRYRVFLFFNVLGGVSWACTFVLLGYLAGSSWRQIENLMGRATGIVAGVLAFVALLVVGARYVSSHRDAIAAKRDELLERPAIARWRQRFRPQLDFVQHRLDPARRFGLYLTLGLLVVVLGAWAFGALLQDVVAHDELALVDRPVDVWMVHHREPWLTSTMKDVTVLGSLAFVIPVAVLLMVGFWAWKRSLRWPVLVVIAVGGARGISQLVKALVDRPRPHLDPLVSATGSAFPSGHTISATVLFGAAAYLFARGRDWKTGVWLWTAAVALSCLVGLSRLYLGVHWLTDVLAGLVLGLVWLAVSAMSSVLPEAWWRRRRGRGEGAEAREAGAEGTEEAKVS